jgi:SAM-dependent methyltransferase
MDQSYQEVILPALVGLLPPPGHLTLDLACGEGRLSRRLGELGHRVVGVDASPTLVSFAASHDNAEPAVLGDAAALPFGDEAFDLVVASMCLHDIDDLPGALRETARVLKPPGRLCAAIPHPLVTVGAFAEPDGDAPFVITGSYLDEAPSRMTIDRGDLRLTFHSEHRPLESYLRAVEEAGLLTETIRETKVPGELVARDPSERRWQRIPPFLHLRALKPAR